MQFVFIDEIECSQKNPRFYGLGTAIFNYSSYHMFKEAYCKYFEELGWDPSIEFKGKYLFSLAGDPNVPIDKRVDFVTNIAKETSASKNSRVKFHFCSNELGNSQKNHLTILEKIVPSVKPLGPRHKKLIAFYLDRNNKIAKDEVVAIINKVCPGLVFERPFFVDSDNQLPGIITVDILNYLQSWVELNPKQENQLGLFDTPASERNKIKLEKVKEILSQVKNVKRINS